LRKVAIASTTAEQAVLSRKNMKLRPITVSKTEESCIAPTPRHAVSGSSEVVGAVGSIPKSSTAGYGSAIKSAAMPLLIHLGYFATE
jgi:hypothetical protein